MPCQKDEFKQIMQFTFQTIPCTHPSTANTCVIRCLVQFVCKHQIDRLKQMMQFTFQIPCTNRSTANTCVILLPCAIMCANSKKLKTSPPPFFKSHLRGNAASSTIIIMYNHANKITKHWSASYLTNNKCTAGTQAHLIYRHPHVHPYEHLQLLLS